MVQLSRRWNGIDLISRTAAWEIKINKATRAHSEVQEKNIRKKPRTESDAEAGAANKRMTSWG